ncbi:MAG: S8 family serine peptidase [Bacteroidales bacterium]|nr:MAG: S8 family serine peptidase [Bacteroidales bacterium]
MRDRQFKGFIASAVKPGLGWFYSLILLIQILPIPVILAQNPPEKYWIQFTDKDNTPYSLDNPDEYLSQRSIQRRLKYGIPVRVNDLPVNPSYIDSIASLGIKILNKSKWFNAITIELTDSSLLDSLLTFGFISGIQNVYHPLSKKSVKEKFTDIAESEISGTGLHSYGFSDWQIMMVNGHILHDLGYQGQGMQIAVIDAGFAGMDILPAFSSLWENDQILTIRDFVDGDEQVFDAHSHGMKVVSIMCGNIPFQLLGTAPKAGYLLLRSEDTSSEFLIEEDNWIAAAEYADSFGVDLINTSLGYSKFDDPEQDHSYTDMDGNSTRISIGADIAASKGILVVTSAGNQGNDPWQFITAPADADSVLSVGAVDSLGYYAPFSSVGPTADGRVKPNIAAMGQGVAYQGTDGSIVTGNGTSFSAPIITGLSACLWQVNTSLNNIELIRKIEESADHYDSPDIFTGYGIPDFASALSKMGIELPEEYYRINYIFPNPFSDEVEINLFSPVIQEIDIQFIDLTGRVVWYEKNRVIVPGSNRISLQQLGKIPGGLYIMKIITPDKILEEKLIKL